MRRLLSSLFALITLAANAAEFDVAASTNAVGLDLFRELSRAKPGENLVLSPYSIESALALAYAGADGDTRAEMARILHFPADDAPLQSGFASLRHALDDVARSSAQLAAQRTLRGGKVDPIQWAAANRLFGQQGYAFRDSFLKLMRDGFSAPFEPLDFRHATEAAREKINAWVEQQTRDKIRNLIPRGALDNDTRLVLVNALYLKAPWENPFTPTATRPRSFTLADATTVEVPTMHHTGPLGHAVEDGFTVVALDYLGGALQCLILLPDEGTSAETAAARLTAAHFARWAKLTATSRSTVALALPKFRIEGRTLPLDRALRQLGMKRAFDEPAGSADFGRIAPRKPNDYLAISQVFHQTFVALDEHGTEASAATAVLMSVFGSIARPTKPIEVRVDRPFLFAIQHRPSAALLFLGHIGDPR